MKTNSKSAPQPPSGLPRELSIEEALTVSRPQFVAPADLRDDIMRQVRVAAKQVPCEQPVGWLHGWRWLFIPAAAALVLLAMIFSRGGSTGIPGPEGASLLTAAQTLPLDGSFPAEVTAALIGPLQEELRHLDGDLKRTAEYLLASVP